MVPSKIILRNFRSFASPGGVELELRPLTVLFGWNNAGKSSLLRALPLIADSIDQDGLDALQLEGRLKPFDLDFESLRFRGRAETDDHTIGIKLRWEGEESGLGELEWALWEQPDWRRVLVKSFWARRSTDEPSLCADWIMTRGEESEAALTYNVERTDSATNHERLQFRGLLPPKQLFEGLASIEPMREMLEAVSGSVLWLRSLREAPARKTRWRGAVRWSLEPDGRDAPILLAADKDVLADVSSFYRDNFGFDLVVQEVGRREVRAILRNRVRASFDIDLIDTGEGLSQCLPVLTALAMTRRGRGHSRPWIVAIEEPEAHLHPHLQRALAERMCDVVREARPRIVIETHSEHILLTLRLQIVKRRLKPEDVILYWVRQLEDGRSVVDRIELDAEGRFIGNWPPDAFQQDIALAADIQDALDQRGDDARGAG